MANKKLRGIIWPNMPNDTYLLDAGEVNYNANETYRDGTAGEALQNKANIDGSYESMTVGNAEQLVSNVRVNDKTPYLFRTSGGSVDIGDREYVNGIVGGTVAWNQLVEAGDFPSPNTWWASESGVTASYADNIVTLSSTQATNGIRHNNFPYTKGHKLLLSVSMKSASAVVGRFGIGSADATLDVTITENDVNKWVIGTKIANTTSSSGVTLYLYASGTYSGLQAKDAMCIDLTQMFGSTIADYIYSLETANAGAGVAWFKKLFNKPYYAYNAGELKSVSGLVSHDMTGFNQLDISECYASSYFSINGETLTNTQTDTRTSPQWMVQLLKDNSVVSVPYLNTETSGNRVIMTFTVSASINADILRLKHNGSTRDLPIFNMPSSGIIKGATYCLSLTLNNGNPTTVGGLVISNICLNLAWDNSRNGEYEPYELHSYPLDSDLTLRGIPKLDANNNLYYDGDTYESDGTVTRKYGILDLGTLDWTREESHGAYRFRTAQYAPITGAPTTGGNKEVVCPKYVYNIAPYANNDVDKVVTLYNGIPILRDDAYTDATAFKTAMNGVYLVYPLATPTTETADPYQQTQVVNDFGTEEYVISDNTFAVPVGSDTDYPVNLVAKLEMAPNSPDGSGDYIVRQTNGVNEYVPLVIEDALPTIPSATGSYVLTVTVVEGSDPTLEWVAQS